MADEIKCPICGSNTRLRTAKKGFDAGKQFYVCISYPECKGRVSYEAQCKRIELDQQIEETTRIIQNERSEFEKYKKLQQDLLQNERILYEQAIERDKAGLQELKTQLVKERELLDSQTVILQAKKDGWIEDTEKEVQLRLERANRREADFNRLVEEKTQGFPWLARAYSAYSELCDKRLTHTLLTKPNPAWKTKDKLKQAQHERREAVKASMISKSLLDYCRYLAPWLDDYIGIKAEELDAIIKNIHSSWDNKEEEEINEELKRQMGPKVWKTLSDTERLQRALDWYWEKPNKANWQLGRDYENYIGYLYECKGWHVNFHGTKGFEDLGRDLICKKDGCVEIIQCKNWSQSKTIHEKNIYYLFGTTVEYYIENFGKLEKVQLSLIPEHMKKKEITAKLITTTIVSPKADEVAKALEVVIERIPSKRYPSVKCNVSRKNGEKIYHLPFDQQYEHILIEEEHQECYVETVAEAEILGFRHAKKWMGDSESTL